MLNKEAFQEWLTHPATLEIRQFLRDRQQYMKDAWGRGELMEGNAQIYAQCYGDLAELTYDDIEGFYDEPDQGSDGEGGG
jgi:hypothetical protein